MIIKRFNLLSCDKQNLIDFNKNEFLAWPPSDFHAFKNVFIENLYNVKMTSSRILLSNAGSQNNNELSNFLVITKTIESGQVEVADITSARLVVEIEKLAQLVSFQSDWRFVLKPGVDTLNNHNGRFSMRTFFITRKSLGFNDNKILRSSYT